MNVDQKIAALEAELAPLRQLKATEAQRLAEEGRTMAKTISARILSDIEALKNLCKVKNFTHELVLIPSNWDGGTKLRITPYGISVEGPLTDNGWDSSSANC